MSPVDLKDILFTGLSVTKGRLKYGQTIAYAIQNFQKIKKICMNGILNGMLILA